MAVSSHSRLPVELTNLIIDFLHDSKPTLKTTALVCHDWLPESRHHLFRQIFFNQYLKDYIDPFLELCQSPLVTFSPAVREFKISLLNPRHGGFDRLLRWKDDSSTDSHVDASRRCLGTILPRVTALSLAWVGIFTLGDLSHDNLFSPRGFWKDTLTQLKLYVVEFLHAEELFALVSSFPLLQLLELNQPVLAFHRRIISDIRTRSYDVSNRTLPPHLHDILLVDVHYPLFIQVLSSCTTVRFLCCSFYDYPEATPDRIEALGQLLRSAKLALKKFTFAIDAPGSSNQGDLDSVFKPHLDLSQNKNLESLNLVINDGRFLIPFLTRLAVPFSPNIDRLSLESLEIRFLNKLTLDWGELDSLLQAPYFSSLREVKCTISVYYTFSDIRGPDGPAEGSETRMKMQEQVRLLSERLPQCAKRGILRPRTTYL